MDRPAVFSEADARRVAAATRSVEQTPRGPKARERRYPVTSAGKNAKRYKVTSKNTCVDSVSLRVGDEFLLPVGDHPQIAYVFARPCDVAGEFLAESEAEDGERDEDTVLVGIPVGFSGFVAYHTVITAAGAKLPSMVGDTQGVKSGALAIDGGVMDIEAVAAGGTTATLYEDEVDAEVVVDFVSVFGDTITTDQPVGLIWEYTPTTASIGTRLRLNDWGCPPE